MAVRRYLRKRGANVAVQAYGEILLRPTGDFGLWKRKVSNRVRRETIKEAPTNKRPRWGHYGDPLKNTIMQPRTETRITKGGGFIFTAVGSSAPHAYYVDQGTGIFNGSAPWKAKVLPPYARGEGSLYEASWHPPGQSANHDVMIKGQRGQQFFEKGLARGWRSVGRSPRIGGKVSAASRIFPEGLANFRGNTPADAGFRASLEEWRAWRNERFDSGRLMGKDGGYRTREGQRMFDRKYNKPPRDPRRAEWRKELRREKSRIRSQKWRDEQRAKSTEKPKQKKTGTVSRSQDRRAFLAAMVKKYKKIDQNSVRYEDGFWYLTVWVPRPGNPGEFWWDETRAKAKS